MFGSSSGFGQSSCSAFGSSFAFGQTSGVNNNPFEPKSFGSTTPFGSQTGSSMFGGSSTGVFGATSSPFSSTTGAFGALSSTAFGSWTPAFSSFGGTATGVFGQTSSPFSFTTGAFGASSSPAFGSSSSAFGSSTLGQKPTFGGFGSTQTSPFGSSPSQPAFGSSIFGSSTPFVASSQPTFGATSSPAFGPNTLGSTGFAFGASTAPVFNTGGAFGASSTPAFGASSTGVFGAPSTPSFSFGSSPAFDQSSSAFGSSCPFVHSTSPFGTQSSPIGAQSTAPALGRTSFGQSTFGGQRGGSRITPYSPTLEKDAIGAQPAEKLESISAMPAYKDKSHEELRWEDYQQGDKGGPLPGGQYTSGVSFTSTSTSTQPNPFCSTPAFAQPSPTPLSSPASTNPFAQKLDFPSLGSSTASTFTSSPFSAPSSSSLRSISRNLFPSTSTSETRSSTPLFGSSTSPAFGSSPSPFNSAASGLTPLFSSGLNFGSTQSSPFASTTPTFGLQPAPSFGQSTPSFESTSTSSFGQSSNFNLPSLGFVGGLFSSTSTLLGQSTPSFSFPFQALQPAQTSTGFGFCQTQAGSISGSSLFGQSSICQSTAAQNSGMVHAVPVTNPFGTLPAMPQISFGRSGSGSSLQLGVSSMPGVDEPVPIKLSSILARYDLSKRRVSFSSRKHHPNYNVAKAMFFTNDDKMPSTPKADAFFIPRENPRTLIIRPVEQWPLRASKRKPSQTKNASAPPHEDGINSEECIPTSNDDNTEATITGQLPGPVQGQVFPDEVTQKSAYDDHSVQRENSYMTASGYGAGEAAVAYEHGANIEALMPKLGYSDYYTVPPIRELAAKERAKPGFCCRIKDFVVGRHGCGSIRFFGETDVRGLDLDSLVQFNNREVIVYKDERNKPPVGQGLNKPAEVTLLNMKSFDKRTGQQITEGPRIERCKEMLKKMAEEQDAQFVSFDPVNGVWKFRVEHFNM